VDNSATANTFEHWWEPASAFAGIAPSRALPPRAHLCAALLPAKLHLHAPRAHAARLPLAHTRQRRAWRGRPPYHTSLPYLLPALYASHTILSIVSTPSYSKGNDDVVATWQQCSAGWRDGGRRRDAADMETATPATNIVKSALARQKGMRCAAAESGGGVAPAASLIYFLTGI